MTCRTLFIAIVLSLTVARANCYAEEHRSICTGYNPASKLEPWSPIGTTDSDTMEQNCPPGQAIVSVIPPGGPRRSGDKVSIHASCCPLPSGVLTETHVYEQIACPENHIATGAKQMKRVARERFEALDRNHPHFWRNSRAQFLRCTKIHTDRFALGPAIPGMKIGYESSIRTMFQPKISRNAIPVGLRYGVGRLGRAKWSVTSCLTTQWGSVLYRKESKYCSGFYFRQILSQGKKGDPPAGEPIRIFPPCIAIENLLSPNPTCVRQGL